MTNHYHLLLETPDGNLSKGMRQLNVTYTQWINRTHRRVGHLFQGRFKGILVEKESCLLELARYIVLNPVRAGMVATAQEWPWSSYRATDGEPLLAQKAGLCGSRAPGDLFIFSKDRLQACDHRTGSQGAIETAASWLSFVGNQVDI